jgi:glucan-binding YG repeat protein
MKLKKLCMILSAVAIAMATPITSMTAFAEERTATQEEINDVNTSGKSQFQWENTGYSWRLLYLKKGASQWKYAYKWVQIGPDFYYFDPATGDMAEGWFQDAAGKWFFAQCDSSSRDNKDAGKVVTGWASIRDAKGLDHIFYFGTDSNGIPSGMYQSSTPGYYKSFTIDDKQYAFDSDGHLNKSSLDDIYVKSYARSRGSEAIAFKN